MGNFSEGEEFVDKGLRLMGETNNLTGIGFVETLCGGVFFAKGAGRGVVHHIQKAIECFEKSQTVLFLGVSWMLLGYGHYLLGQHETALGFIDKGLKIQTDLGMPFWMSSHYFGLGTVHCDLGNLEEARSHAERAVKLSQQNNERQWEGLSRFLLGRITGKMDSSQVNEAEDQIQHGIKIFDELKFRPFHSVGRLFLGELYAEAGQREKALENLKKTESMFQDTGMDYWLNRTQEVLARL